MYTCDYVRMSVYTSDYISWPMYTASTQASLCIIQSFMVLNIFFYVLYALPDIFQSVAYSLFRFQKFWPFVQHTVDAILHNEMKRPTRSYLLWMKYSKHTVIAGI